MSESALPALNGDNGSSRLDNVEGQGITEAKPDAIVNLGDAILSARDRKTSNEAAAYVTLPLVLLNPPWFGVPKWITPTMEMSLASSLLVSGHCCR